MGLGQKLAGVGKGERAREAVACMSVLDESFCFPPVLRNLMLFLGTCWT